MFHWVAEVSQVDSRALPVLFLFVDSYLIIDFCGGMGAGDLLLCYLGEVRDNSLLYKLNGRVQG